MLIDRSIFLESCQKLESSLLSDQSSLNAVVEKFQKLHANFAIEMSQCLKLGKTKLQKFDVNSPLQKNVQHFL